MKIERQTKLTNIFNVKADEEITIRKIKLDNNNNNKNNKNYLEFTSKLV